LLVTSILAFYALGFLAMIIYGRTMTWSEADARGRSVFWVYEMLDRQPAAKRGAALRSTKGQFTVDFRLVTKAEVERRAGRSVRAGERVFVKESPRRQWYFIVFRDDHGALAAGPVNPTIPFGATPVGLILAILFVPLIASYIAFRVARRLQKVERASEALGAGELSVRVDSDAGPAHELAESFNAMAGRIERLVKGRDELIQAVSHELGSPLSRLRFHIELLENETDEHARRSLLEEMSREMDELDELEHELLTWVQSGEQKLEPVRFSAVKPLTELAELARLQRADAEDIDVQLELDDSVLVFADPRQFQRALENILRNAQRYAKRIVRLTLAEGPDAALVTVEDDGPGIPAPMREKVLQPFVRLESDRSRESGGVGLGLAIVNRIVQSHGGSVSVSESSTGGARITTRWPNRH
jgi:signal transduction histidine kinase